MVAQSLLGLGFSAVWSTLAIWLHGAPFHLGAGAAGAFGLAGAAGAVAAPVFGRLADRHGSHAITLLGAGIAAVSFAAMPLALWLPPELRMVWLAATVLGFDLGFQSALVAHQTLIYSIDPGARSRLNAMLFVSMFSAMALGAALASQLFAEWGWVAVSALATGAALLAALVRWLPVRSSAAQTA